MRLATGDASMRCDYCKTVVVLPADDAGVHFLEEGVDGVNCPDCSIPLWDALLGGVKLSACKRCKGMLIPMSAFEPLIEELREKCTDPAIPSAADPADLRRKVDCPQCLRHMDVHFYMGGGGAIIATCENCEANWLDGGMLMRIVRAPHEESSLEF
ncbi:MAG TPA: zf-TFIIB domain-containing protein [Terracidiphilus sp.]|nr:zf-TFIIB domain-containing protein [Terracidiphilus sp.]